ncbi:putative efflux ABC transporter, permease protein [Bifidobacterium saguini DSM 23967]|uniref:ABC transporter permease n=2 Tax=Bifidobacterium saguini TaxID=762210 RepID=A0ABX7SCT8_9BIFI|nr:ABC transporter permease [Bifidobacterium saguini]KFI93416.1 putative efflux ABC transporter, permease protein [Bifidobacterium saguini DSM 23967]QTB90615.1 ABC transporter permease [Bifidobacterium saguini]
MIIIGLRDARAHFGRFVMSIIAIALGVSFVVGSFCFREMMNNQVDQMMASNSDADVYVRGNKEQKDSTSATFGASSDSGSGSSSSSNSTSAESKNYNRIDIDLADTINGVTGVDTAEAVYEVNGLVLVGKDDNAVSTTGGVTVGMGLAKGTWRSATLTQGRWAKAKDEITLHTFAAESAGLKIGDTTKIVYPDGPADVHVVGIFSTASSQAGAIIIGLNPQTAKEYFQQQSGQVGTARYLTVYGSAAGGQPLNVAQQQTLADSINAALPSDAHAVAVTGQSVRDDNAASTKKALGFIQPLILIFAIIALFVGSFIITNTFSMIVRESMRGYALLRSIGASPIQVFITVAVQAILLGLVGSGIGIGLGWLMVKGIVALMAHMGTPMTGAVDPSISDMLIGLIVGVLVTFVGASLPARRAATAPPIQAMNETVNPEKPVWPRGITGTVMIVLGSLAWLLCWRIAWANDADVAVSDWSWFNNGVKSLGTGWPLGIGAGLVVIGVIVLAPALVTPTSAVLGWIPAHVFTVTGKLATRNLSRSKRRTANTAAALFVGVAIVSCLSVVAASAKASVAGIVDSGLQSDFSAMSVSSGQIPDDAIAAIKKTKGVGTVSQSRMLMNVTYGSGDDATVAMTFAEQPSLFTKVFAPVTNSGDANTALRNGELVVGLQVAKDNGWKVGDTVKVNGQQVVVDKEATAKAQADYQAQVKTNIDGLTAEAQRLLAAGDTAGAQAKSAEAQKAAEDAQNVDPATLVKTKTETTHVTMKIGAIIENSIYRSMVLMNDDAAGKIANQYTMFTIMLFINAKHGTNINVLKARLIKAVKPYYVVNVQDRDEFKSTMSSMVDQILLVLYALLALSIVIAIFGIVNTLALSVSERTKEIGLLRAIGTSRAQVRGMLGIEASIIAVFGTVLGMVVGVAAGVVIRAVYEANGLSALSIPLNQLGAFLVLSILVGLIASVSPASRALKQPVLDAVAAE